MRPTDKLFKNKGYPPNASKIFESCIRTFYIKNDALSFQLAVGNTLNPIKCQKYGIQTLWRGQTVRTIGAQ